MNSPDILVVGPESDRLDREAAMAPPQWAGQTPTKKIAVVATMRDEGLSILEWIAHYRVIGADTICIYTNDNHDGSDALLEALAKAGVIRLRWNILGPGSSAQNKAYRHAFWLDAGLRQHEWIAFLDADEFLFPVLDGEQKPLPVYLDTLRQMHGCSAICLNWKWFSGNADMRRTEGLLFDRFTAASSNDHVKTIFRPADVLGVSPHIPFLKSGHHAIDGFGRGVDADSLTPLIPPGYELGQINHYWNKSFEEYYLKQAKAPASGSWRDVRRLNDFYAFASEGYPTGYPDEKHVADVKAEISRLLSLPGVRTAEASTLETTRQILSGVDIVRLYKKAKKRRSSIGIQAFRFRSHVKRAFVRLRPSRFE